MARPINVSTSRLSRPRLRDEGGSSPVVPTPDDPNPPAPPVPVAPTPPAPAPPAPPPAPIIPDDPDPDETDVDDNKDDPDDPAPTPDPGVPPPTPPLSTAHPLCDAARFLLPEHQSACNSLEKIVADGRACNITPQLMTEVRDAFLTENTDAHVGVWFGIIAKAVCEVGIVLSSDMAGAAIAREYAAPVLSTPALLRFLTETSRREAMISFSALNPSSMAEGLWQMLPSTRDGLREKYAPWLDPWPSANNRGPDFDLTALMQAQYCAVYVVRLLANLGSNFDFAHGPVKGRGENASFNNSKLKAIGAAAISRGVVVTAEMLLIGCLNLGWDVGPNPKAWDAAAINKAGRMMLAVQAGKTWGNAK